MNQIQPTRLYYFRFVIFQPIYEYTYTISFGKSSHINLFPGQSLIKSYPHLIGLILSFFDQKGQLYASGIVDTELVDYKLPDILPWILDHHLDQIASNDLDILVELAVLGDILEATNNSEQVLDHLLLLIDLEMTLIPTDVDTAHVQLYIVQGMRVDGLDHPSFALSPELVGGHLDQSV